MGSASGTMAGKPIHKETSMQPLQGGVAVVTGAARAIGLVLATRLAAAGTRLVMADVEAAALGRALAQLRAAGAANACTRNLKTLGARLSASVLCPGVVRTAILDAERRRAAQFGGPGDRHLTGAYVTSLEMAGCSITVSAVDADTLALWDAPVHTAALRWGL